MSASLGNTKSRKSRDRNSSRWESCPAVWRNFRAREFWSFSVTAAFAVKKERGCSSRQDSRMSLTSRAGSKPGRGTSIGRCRDISHQGAAVCNRRQKTWAVWKAPLLGSGIQRLVEGRRSDGSDILAIKERRFTNRRPKRTAGANRRSFLLSFDQRLSQCLRTRHVIPAPVQSAVAIKNEHGEFG